MSTVYAGQTVLLSERDHQMCLVKLANLGDLYRTEMFEIDKVTGKMYAVIDGAAKSIDLQAYIEEETEKLEGADGFTPTDTSTLKDMEASGKPHSKDSKLSELSTIKE